MIKPLSPMTTSFDIVSIYNNSPLLNLTKKYEETMISKINITFNTEEQQTFIGSFFGFINYKDTDFCIYLDNVFSQIGFTRKSDCKKLLLKYFKENTDYIINNEESFSLQNIEKSVAASAVAGIIDKNTNINLGGAGLNKEHIYMTIKCFKKLCMKARTAQADKIHDYYIKLEEIVMETIREQSADFANQLTQKENEIKTLKNSNTNNNEKELLLNYNGKRCFYMCIFPLIIDGILYTVIKFGITNDILTRITAHKCQISKDLVLIYVVESLYNNAIERKIKDLCKTKGDILYNKRISHVFPGYDREQTELVKLDDNLTVEKLLSKIRDIEKNINKDEVVIELENKLEKAELEWEKLQSEMEKIKLERILSESEIVTEQRNTIEKLQLELSLKNEKIEKVQSEKTLESTIKEEKIEKLNLELSLKDAVQTNQIVKMNTTIKTLQRSHVSDIILPIIVKNIKTSEEISFPTIIAAQRHFGSEVSPMFIHTIKNYIDKHKQLNGCILRSSKNEPYWITPDNFKFGEYEPPTTQNVYVKCVHKISGEVVYYNSMKEAALFLVQEMNIEKLRKQIYDGEIDAMTEKELYDKTVLKNTDLTTTGTKLAIYSKALRELLRGKPTRKKEINTYNWYKMEDIGFMIQSEGARICIDKVADNIGKKEDEVEELEEQEEQDGVVSKPPLPVKTISQLIDDKVPIFVRNIKTGEEFQHPEGYRSNTFIKNYGMPSKDALAKKFLNQQINFKEFIFRTQDTPEWNPPVGYKYETANVRLGYFIKVEKEGEIHYFCNISTIGKLLFPNEGDQLRLGEIIKARLSSRGQKRLDDPIGKMVNDHKYTWTKLKSCGTLIYTDGTIKNNEVLF